MRHCLAEMLHLIAAVDGMTILHEEDCMRHGSIVPFLAETLFIESGVKVPDGVEYPDLPVDTGQSYRCIPSNATVILCLVLSMLMRMVGAAGVVALGAT